MIDIPNTIPIDISVTDASGIDVNPVKITHWINDGHLAHHTPEFFSNQLSGSLGEAGSPGQLPGPISGTLQFDF